MQKVNDALRNQIKELESEDFDKTGDPVLDAFRDTALKWADVVLKNHNGKAREAGLKISGAMIDYVDELRGHSED